MRFVVDASVAIKWLVEEEESDIAQEMMSSDQELHAPRLMAAEVANALWRKARMNDIEQDVAESLLSGVPELPVYWEMDEILADQAARLAFALDRPVYDCFYLALAYRIGAVVVTADVRFANALRSAGHRQSVMTLTDFAKTL